MIKHCESLNNEPPLNQVINAFMIQQLVMNMINHGYNAEAGR